MARGFQLRLAVTGNLRQYAEKCAGNISLGATLGADRFRARAKIEIRSKTRPALGDRAANTWRDARYPTTGQSWHPTVLLYSKWPIPIAAHMTGATIRHKEGRMLAIPTDKVPRRNGRPATPVEVEAMFNQDLIVKPSRKNAGTMYAFVSVVAAKNKRGFRAATKKRLAQGRGLQLVLMFVFVRQVTLRPSIPTIETVRDDLAPMFAQYIAEGIAGKLSA